MSQFAAEPAKLAEPFRKSQRGNRDGVTAATSRLADPSMNTSASKILSAKSRLALARHTALSRANELQ